MDIKEVPVQIGVVYSGSAGPLFPFEGALGLAKGTELYKSTTIIEKLFDTLDERLITIQQGHLHVFKVNLSEFA